MTNQTWALTLLRFEQNLEAITKMQPFDPTPSAKLCRESAHRTLGHLTACQTAWLPLMQQMAAGALSGAISINPDPLYTRLGYVNADWTLLVQRFTADRAEWRQLLQQVDLDQPFQTPTRATSARALTRRMVEHEKRHLNAVLPDLLLRFSLCNTCVTADRIGCADSAIRMNRRRASNSS